MEVTEKWFGASKGPGNSRKSQMVLTLRVSQPFSSCLRCEPGSKAEGCLYSHVEPAALSRRTREGEKTSALELRLLPVTPGSLCTEGQAAAFRVAHVRPVSSIQCLEEFPEKNGTHFGVLLACLEKGMATAQGLPHGPDLFLIPQGSGVRGESERMVRSHDGFL